MEQMMKVTFEFQLPEEQNEYEVMSQSQKMQFVLLDFMTQLRSWQKYHHDFKDADDALDKIREEFYKIINEHNVNIEL
jgi:hypothetical protein